MNFDEIFKIMDEAFPDSEMRTYEGQKRLLQNEKYHIYEELDGVGQLVGFKIGTRESKHFQKLTDKISHIDAKLYASDYWRAYKLIAPSKHLVGKAHTYTVELISRFLRHYLARFARKTYCYSKSLQMIKFSLLLFIHRESVQCMKV